MFPKSSDLFEFKGIWLVSLVHLNNQKPTNHPLPARLRLDLYLLPGPANLPSNWPLVKILLPSAGNSFESRSSTFAVLLPQQFLLLARTTFPTDTLAPSPKSMANQGAGSALSALCRAHVGVLLGSAQRVPEPDPLPGIFLETRPDLI